MIITKKNLFINGKCRFCQVKEHEKHYNCYHGFRDFTGIESLNLQYMTDKELSKKLKHITNNINDDTLKKEGYKN